MAGFFCLSERGRIQLTESLYTFHLPIKHRRWETIKTQMKKKKQGTYQHSLEYVQLENHYIYHALMFPH